jgi:hypothetical protein
MKRTLLIGALAVVAAAANAQIGISGSSVAFVDISVSGTSYGTGGDDIENTIAGATHGWIGNDLLAGGMSMRIGNNGGLMWGTSATDAFVGATEQGYINASPAGVANPFGTMAASNAGATGNGGGIRQYLAVLWDDNTPGTGGSVKWQVIGNDLIVQWTNEDHFNATGTGTVTYEMIAHGGVTIASGLSLVDFVYQDTLYAANQYQDDGGSATIGYKNWGVNANANDVEYGVGGGTNALSDPAFGDASMKPKVAGWVGNNDPNGALVHSVTIAGVPEPSTFLAIGAGLALLAARRRRK